MIEIGASAFIVSTFVFGMFYVVKGGSWRPMLKGSKSAKHITSREDELIEEEAAARAMERNMTSYERSIEQKEHLSLMKHMMSEKGLSLNILAGNSSYIHSADLQQLLFFIKARVRLIPESEMYQELNNKDYSYGHDTGKDIVRHKLLTLIEDELDFLRTRLEAQDFAYFREELSRELRNRLQKMLLGQGMVVMELVAKVADRGNHYSSNRSYDGSAKIKIDPEVMKNRTFSQLVDITPDVEIPEEYAVENLLSHSDEGQSEEQNILDTSTSLLSSSTLPPRASLGSSSRYTPLDVLSVRLDELEDAWMKYELDPLLVLSYPLMADATCKETNAFVVAMNKVKTLNRLVRKDMSLLSDFSTALEAAEEAFVNAEANARKMRHVHLDAEQRKKIKDARPLVAMLNDEEASPQEKINAYRKAGDFLEGIIALPERPVLGLLSSS